MTDAKIYLKWEVVLFIKHRYIMEEIFPVELDLMQNY